MSDLVAFSLSGSTIPGAFQVGNIAYATSSAIVSGSSNLAWGYRPPAEDRYTFISDSYTQSLSNSTEATPLFFISPSTNPSDVLDTINRLPDRINQTSFTNVNSALNWVSGSGKYVTLITGSIYTGSVSFLLQANGSYLLQANGDRLILKV